MMRTLMAVLLMTSLAYADDLIPSVEELVDFETKSNAVADRSNEKVRIQNYEIPLRLLEQDISMARLPHAAWNAVTFTNKKGEKMVRWLINPEDTKWHLELEQWLVKNGVSTKKHTYFDAYMTASRSYVVRDPRTGLSFSMKVSTNVTGGAWRDKKQSWDDARQVKQAADFIAKAMDKRAPENFIYMDEPMVFGVRDLDQGMILRLLADLNVKDRTYIPGFAILHEQTGREIAKMNGSNDPATFWRKHYMAPLGKALAEMAAMTGLTYDSPHSQNFLVEFDEKMRPTGKIVLRDLGDAFLSKEIVSALHGGYLLSIWEPSNLRNGLMVAEGVLHGNHKPSWVSETIYDEYGKTFFAAFEAEFSKVTGVSKAELAAEGSPYRNRDYISKSYSMRGSSGMTMSEGWSSYLKGLDQNGGLKARLNSCGMVFLK